MKKSILILALTSMFGISSAYAVDPISTANSVTSTYANAGNGGTSHSTASNFALFSGTTNISTGPGSLSVAAPACDYPNAVATVTGTLTTVTGSAFTMGGSSASNTSTGNGSGSAFAGGSSQSFVTREASGVSGSALSNTATVANASKGESQTSFASQKASFTAEGATGSIVVATPGHIIASGSGAASTGTADVGKSTQNYSLTSLTNCGGGCKNGTGTANFTNWTGTGSDTNGQASTYTNITFTAQ